MKKLFTILFFIRLSEPVVAQETVEITPGMFNSMNEILLGTMDGWYFKTGTDTNWKAKDLDMSGWRSLKPIAISTSLADETGRVEGWLRLRLRPAPGFGSMPFYLAYRGWGAADIYLDGQKIFSFGRIGTGKNSFREFNAWYKPAVPIELIAGKEHLLAIHFADYVSSYFPKDIKSAENDLRYLIRLTGPAFQERMDKQFRDWPVYTIIWITATIILNLLFWLLVYLTPREKNLKLFAVCAIFFGLQIVSSILIYKKDASFDHFKLWTYSFTFFTYLSTCMTIIAVSYVFKNNLAKWLKWTMIFYMIAGIADMFTKNNNIIISLTTLTSMAIYSWFIVSSWKNLKGAQWVIVAGLLARLILTILFVVLVFRYQTFSFPNNLLVGTLLYLSFQVALVVYVAFRFREIIRDLRQNAEEVLKLSEEKRVQAVKQQKLLEEEVARQTIELRSSLEHLKSTQDQLIQSEKMASLGELTAGIAHEIQNPLNFVNNFSEVNAELLDELREQLAIGNMQLANELAQDLKQNEEKISHHGKRADAIVKSMLQHSRISSGKPEMTDINALVEEYLRLAFHGLRAKDPRDSVNSSFNVKIETDFDPAIEKIRIVPQDIGRVLINLINNAFYTVNEKKQDGKDPGFEPLVRIVTKKQEVGIAITIVDNGNGILQSSRDKIFQPFFTTKPTGQGTGLGLSLSYDIVKAHGGELKVETNEGQGSVFTILFPSE